MVGIYGDLSVNYPVDVYLLFTSLIYIMMIHSYSRAGGDLVPVGFRWVPGPASDESESESRASMRVAAWTWQNSDK